MANPRPRSSRAVKFWRVFVVRAVSIAFVPAMLPPSWTGNVDKAFAACSLMPDGAFHCVDFSTGEYLSNSPLDELKVVAEDSLRINSLGIGFELTSDGDSLSFAQESGSTITSGTTGILTTQTNGSSHIDVAGDVTGNGDYAIVVFSSGTATDVTVQQTAGTLTAISHGIRVDNYGTGSASITTAGTINQLSTGSDSYGVYAFNSSTAKDIMLTQTGGTITAHNYGIYGNNYGSGSITINAAGDVTATGRIGLAAYNIGASSKDVTINQTSGTINAAGAGIDAINNGTGSTHITVSGTILSTDVGVVASNVANAKDVVIQQTAGSISGGNAGIAAWNNGTGITSITVHGDVHGGAIAGILAGSRTTAIDIAPSATVSTTSGLAIANGGPGVFIVNNAGRITGDTSLGINNDTFNLTAGSYTGSIYGEVENNPMPTGGNDTFNWTGGTLAGGFYGQEGSDSALVSAQAYDGSQVLDGGDDTSVVDGMIDTLSLRGVSASTSGSRLPNWEIVRLDGSTLAINDGTWKSGAVGEDATGVFLSNGAMLDGMTALALDGNLNMDASSTFTARGGGAGVYSVSGKVNNTGTITMQDGMAGDVMTIAGNYAATEGKLHLDTMLGSDSAPTDQLLIGGDTSGTTHVTIHNAGGGGAPTVEGIRIIGIGGRSDGSFSLVGNYMVNGRPAVVAGAYAYQLYKGGVSTPNDGDWYLRSQLSAPEPDTPVPTPVTPRYQAGAPSYEAYPQALLALNSLPTLQQRVGNRYWSSSAGPSAQSADASIEGNGLWSRVEGTYRNITPSTSSSDTSYKQNVFSLQIGADRVLSASPNGKLIGGLALRYIRGNTWTRSVHGDGDIKTDGYGLGATLTWYNRNGLYLDGQARATWYHSDLSSRLAATSLVKGNDGFGYAASIEGGQRFTLSPSWTLTPQAQLAYSNIDFDTFSDAFGARISMDAGASLQGRLGVTLDHESTRTHAHRAFGRVHIYGTANVHYEFLDGTRVNLAGTRLTSSNDRLWASLGAGGSYNWNGDKYSIYGEALYNTSLSHFAQSYSVIARVGLRVRW